MYLERKYGTENFSEKITNLHPLGCRKLSVYADSCLNRYLSKIEQSYPPAIRYSNVSKNSVDINTRYLQGGLLLMDNNTGHVLAMIGGRNFTHSKYNRINQAKRQPGSSIKPTYYTAALEKGYTPATVIIDSPITLTGGDGKEWTPQNFSRQYYGPTRMRTAMLIPIMFGQ